MRCWMLIGFFVFSPAFGQGAPFTVAPNLFDATRPDDLGLKPVPGTETFTVYRAGEGGDHYVNGVVLLGFKGKLYAQWQSSYTDEDSPDTHVVYAVSPDGAHWSAPNTLVPAGKTMRSSGGWWSNGKTLTAFITVWNADFHSGGTTQYVTSKDGVHWSKPRAVTDGDGKPVDGVIEQDPHALPDGRIVAAFHLKPGLIATPFFTDDPNGTTGWRRGAMTNLPHDGLESRELEPSWFRRADGCLVMVFRDQTATFQQLAAKSCDRGAHWTTPTLTALPDSRAKQSAGNLPDGTAYIVNEPSGTKLRSPLVLTLSMDGLVFNRAYLLRGGPPPEPRFSGLYKRVGYHYPKSIVWHGALYVGYATAKEDVDVTRVPLVARE